MYWRWRDQRLDQLVQVIAPSLTGAKVPAVPYLTSKSNRNRCREYRPGTVAAERVKSRHRMSLHLCHLRRRGGRGGGEG
jgi:hypothetical protein